MTGSGNDMYNIAMAVLFSTKNARGYNCYPGFKFPAIIRSGVHILLQQSRIKANLVECEMRSVMRA